MPTSKYLREGEIETACATESMDVNSKEAELWSEKMSLQSQLEASLHREAVLAKELNKLIIKHSDTLNELDKAVLTIRDWHTVALKMRDLSITGKTKEIERVYFDTALGLPFYGAQGEPLPSERKPPSPTLNHAESGDHDQR